MGYRMLRPVSSRASHVKYPNPSRSEDSQRPFYVEALASSILPLLAKALYQTGSALFSQECICLFCILRAANVILPDTEVPAQSEYMGWIIVDY
jgi:hypothetical protein